MSSAEEYYDFRYTVFEIRARFSETHLEVKMGMRTVVVPLDQLQYVYVDDRKSRESIELIISCLTPKGKQVRSRVFADHYEPGFYALVDALLERRPSADIRSLSLDDAYECLGTKQLEWAAIPLLMAIGLALTALMCIPLLMHGCDDGRAHLKLAQLARHPDLPTRNVQIRDYTPLLEFGVGEKKESKEGSHQDELWIPTIAKDALPHEPIGVIIQVRLTETEAFEMFRKGQKLDGTIRNIWWEGLAGRQRRFLKEKGVVLDDQVTVVEIGVEPEDDLNLALFILIALSIPVLGVCVVLWRKAPGRLRIALKSKSNTDS